MKTTAHHIGHKSGFQIIPWKLSGFCDKRKVRPRRGETIEAALTRQLRGMSEVEQIISRDGKPTVNETH